MTKEMSTRPQVHLIRPYLVWTFGWSWGLWLTAILLNTLSSGRLGALAIPAIVLGSFGPALGTKRTLKLSFRELWAYIFSGRAKTWLPLVLLMILETITYVLASPGLNPERALWTAPLRFIFILVCGGGNEEIGWRGFLQPALEKRFNFPIATLLTGLIWTLWHVPAWFIPGSSQAGTSFLLFVVDVLVISFAFAGLYKHSQSIWYCGLFHAFNNTLAGSFVQEGLNHLIYLIGIGLMAIYASWLWYQTQAKERKEE